MTARLRFSLPQGCQVRFGGDIAFEISENENIPISITNKRLMEISLPFSIFSVFIDADHPTLTLEQKSGRSSHANQTYL